MTRRIGAASLVSAIALLFTGCAVGADGALGCDPGASAQCACLDGTPSAHVCDVSGSYGACACSAMPAPPGAGASPVASATNGAQSSTATATPSPAASSTPSSMSTPAPSTPAPAAPAPIWPSFGLPSAMMGPSQSGAAGSAANPPAVGRGGDVPASEHCAPAAAWNPQWVAFEEEVLSLTNEQRAQGATCGEYGPFEPAPPLVMNAMLRCSSRLHSMDMGQQNYFAHDNPDGLDPYARMAAAGYMGVTMGENIAKGQQSPSEVVMGWMNSPGHCSNMMNAQYAEIGVGFFAGMASNERYNANTLWTQNFGAPRDTPGHCGQEMDGCNN